MNAMIPFVSGSFLSSRSRVIGGGPDAADSASQFGVHSRLNSGSECVMTTPRTGWPQAGSSFPRSSNCRMRSSRLSPFRLTSMIALAEQSGTNAKSPDSKTAGISDGSGSGLLSISPPGLFTECVSRYACVRICLCVLADGLKIASKRIRNSRYTSLYFFRHWQDTLWGTSTVFVAWGLYFILAKEMPTWATWGAVTVAAFSASYYAWRSEYLRSVPKLTLVQRESRRRQQSVHY